MGVLTNIDRALNVLSYPVIDDGLSDCEDMPLIEGGVRALPRWPLVPKATDCSAAARSGISSK